LKFRVISQIWEYPGYLPLGIYLLKVFTLSLVWRCHHIGIYA